MEARHLAQLNIGRIRYEIEDPRMADFANNLAMVNGLAERTPLPAVAAAVLDDRLWLVAPVLAPVLGHHRLGRLAVLVDGHAHLLVAALDPAGELEPLLAECLPYYEELAAHRLRG